MPRKHGSQNLPRESVLKIDKDCHVDSQLEQEYIRNTVAILSKHHVIVVLIRATRTQHGRHYYIRVNPPVDAHVANRLQYLLGDDPKRVAYNEARIKSSLPEWNKLFERIDASTITVYRGRRKQVLTRRHVQSCASRSAIKHSDA